MRSLLIKSWAKPNVLTVLLWPLSLLYRGLFLFKKGLYSTCILKPYKAPVPIVVVGNITVGGTGKTPLVIALVGLLKEMGLRPGVISRGYASSASQYPLWVDSSTSYLDCGDEPKLIQNRTGVPLVVGPDRKADIEALIGRAEVDVIISDDGLQHFAMQRDVEICISDKTQSSTNVFNLPAGPYREPLSRLNEVDISIVHTFSDSDFDQELSMSLRPSNPISMGKGAVQFDPEKGLHAVAGIGNPDRFFATCLAQGWQIERHAFDDHHPFTADDLEFNDTLPVLMTEKDAVKCHEFANDRHWYLPVDARISDSFRAQFKLLIKGLNLVSD